MADSTGEVRTGAFEACAGAEHSVGWLPLVLAPNALPVIVGLVWFIAMNRGGDDEEDEQITDSRAG